MVLLIHSGQISYEVKKQELVLLFFYFILPCSAIPERT